MKCEKHPLQPDFDCVKGCPKCSQEEHQDIKKIKESISDDLARYGILKVLNKDSNNE